MIYVPLIVVVFFVFFNVHVLFKVVSFDYIALQHLAIRACFSRVTNLLMKDPQNTRRFPWTRLKTLVFTANSTNVFLGFFYLPPSLTSRTCPAANALAPCLFPFRYYALEVTYFKSSLDRKLLELLWNKYWVNTLSSSSLLTVRGQPQNVKMFANCLTVWFMAKLLLYNSLGRAVTGPRCGDLLQPNSQKFAFIDFGNKLNLNFLTLSSGLLKPCWAPAKHLRRGSPFSSPRPPAPLFPEEWKPLTWIPIVDADAVSLAWLNSPNRHRA